MNGFTKEEMLQAKRELCQKALAKLAKKYGTFRVATIDHAEHAYEDDFVMFTAAMTTPGDVPITATTVLDPGLWALMQEAWGSVFTAARMFGLAEQLPI